MSSLPVVCSGQTWCEHSNTRVQILPPGSLHFAKEICSDCDRVLRWLPKPSTLEHRRFNALRIAQLSMNESLSDYERRFIKSLAHQRKLSPRQQSCLDKIYAERLGETTR